MRLLFLRLGFGALAFLCLSCLEIHIPPPQIKNEAKKNIKKKISQTRKGILRINWEGERQGEKDWVKALSISRFFYSGIHNRSGSLQELIEAPIKEFAKQRGFKELASQEAPESPKEKTTQTNPIIEGKEYELKIKVKRQQLLWLAPVEFIQTPRARRRGEIRLDFFILTQLLVPKSPSSLAQDKEISFQRKETLSVFPGNEKEALELIAHRALEEYLEELTDLLKLIPP